jgi:hypothetical protein
LSPNDDEGNDLFWKMRQLKSRHLGAGEMNAGMEAVRLNLATANPGTTTNSIHLVTKRVRDCGMREQTCRHVARWPAPCRLHLVAEIDQLTKCGVCLLDCIRQLLAGLVAPAGTPPAVVTKLNAALRAVIDSPDVQARFKNVGFEGFSSTPEELGAFMKTQLGVWEKMVKDADIKPN